MGMTIDEAIERNEKEAFKQGVTGYRLTAKAIRLGIEALKRVKEQSVNPKFGQYKPLLGEKQ